MPLDNSDSNTLQAQTDLSQQAPISPSTSMNTPQEPTPTQPPAKSFPVLKVAIFIFAVILAIGIMFAFYFVTFVKKTNKAVSQESKQVQPKWQLYTNKFAGYSFEYPTGWFITQGKGENQNVFVSSSDPSQYKLNIANSPTTINIESVASVKSLEEVYNEQIKDLSPNSFIKQNTTLGNEKAIIIKFESAELGGKTIVLAAKHNDKIIGISTLVETGVNVEEVFDHIKASFKFTVPEKIASKPDQLKTKLDKYKGSDLFLNQKLFEVYFREKNIYPKDFNDLLDTFKTMNQDTANVRALDPAGQPYQYKPLDNQTDYQITTILDDGTMYIVYGHSMPILSANDVHRLSDLSTIAFQLLAYQALPGHKYPDKLSELLPDYGITVNNKPPAVIPKDPTGKDYSYIALDDNRNYELSAVLDNGLTIYYRGK